MMMSSATNQHQAKPFDHLTTNDTCKPQHQILFLKTHKTGSSTLTSILQVYGFLRNLTFVVPETAQILSRGFFKADQVRPGKYDMLVNHARYNKTEMEKVMKPNTKYITIIRDPSTQIESNFGYFFLNKVFHLENETNPFRTFVLNPLFYWKTYNRNLFRNYMRNPNLFDFGLSETDQEDILTVKQFIKRLSKDFDLVLIQEYFNESLLLLKKMFCWEMDDVIYLIKGERSNKIRYTIEPELRETIRNWSWADAMLYEHFNKTFWRKVDDYGPSFKADLQEFEFKLNKMFHNCTLPRIYDNTRERFYQRNPNGARKCSHLLRIDLDFTELIRDKQYREDKTT
ncbi:galactosylceramide sulfotransferase-like [Antedon mediterranea]